VLDDSDKVIASDSFASRYIPEDAIYLVGKGAALPGGQTLAGLYPGYTGSTAGVDLAHWLGKPAKKKKPAGTTSPTTGIPGIPDGATNPGSTIQGDTTTGTTTTGQTTTGTTTTGQ
jgi:hypothetical protein